MYHLFCRTGFAFQFEITAQVVLPNYRVGGQFFRRTVEEDLSFEEQVCAVGDHQRLIDVMVRN